jgi:hypothetical protein
VVVGLDAKEVLALAEADEALAPHGEREEAPREARELDVDRASQRPPLPCTR